MQEGVVDVSGHIKSKDLCNRCSYAFDRHCSEEMQGNCFSCVMYNTGEPGGCKCLAINPNTPCPYFEEEKDDG